MRDVEIDVPEGCAIAAGPLADYPLLGEEALCVERARRKRRRQFASGRHFARLAMARLNGGAQPILRDTDGRPIWPAGIVGSISHSDSLAAAAVSAGPLRGLGIDVEDAHRLDNANCRLSRKLFTARECAKGWADSREASVLFSGKEAAYKAIHPLVGKYIAFREVEAEIDWRQGSFRMRYLGDHEPNHLLETGDGRFCFIENQVLTMFFIP